MVSESSFSFVSYNQPPHPRPPRQCAGGPHPTGMHSCFTQIISLEREGFREFVLIENTPHRILAIIIPANFSSCQWKGDHNKL